MNSNLASIIDYPRDGLDTDIWKTDSDEITLQPNVKDEIEDIVESFLDDLHLPSEALKDVLIYGSILTNQYNSKTDVDARILLDPEIIKDIYPNITGDDLYDMSVNFIHGIDLASTKHPFNATVVVEGESTMLGEAPLGITDRDPVYSLRQNKLVHEGKWHDESFDPDVEFQQEREEIDQVMDALDKIIQEAKSKTIDFEMIQDAVAHVKNPEKLVAKLEAKLNDIEESLAELVAEYEKLREERSQSYKETTEDDRHQAPGNIQYKMLEKYKYIDLMKKIKSIFEEGLEKSEVPEVAEALQVTSMEKQAFPYKQMGPPQVEEAKPTTVTLPPLEETPQSQDEGGGSFYHPGSCPSCGHRNQITAREEGQEITCAKCGKKFGSMDQPLAINTAPSQTQHTLPYESDLTIYSTAQLQDIEQKQLADLIKTLKEVGVSDLVIKDLENRINNPETGTTTAPKSVDTPHSPGSPEAPAEVGKNPSTGPEPMQGTPPTNPAPTDEAGQAQKVLMPNKQMKQLGEWAHLKAATIFLGGIYMDHEIINKPASLFDDGVPGKEPGASPYADTGKAMAEYGKEEKDGKVEIEPDDNEVMEVVTVLDGMDILPFIEDDELIQELLKMFPLLGNPSKKVDEGIDKLLPAMKDEEEAPIKVEVASKKEALVTEPAEGSGQYVRPTDKSDYEEDPGESKAQSTPELTEENAKVLGEKIGIKWEEAGFDPVQFLAGIKVELEHGSQDPETDITGNDHEITGKIAWAHLKENPEYYIKLNQMEKEADMYVRSRAYITLCPHCKSMQQVDYWEASKCPNCGNILPGYFWKNTEEELGKGGPKEEIPPAMMEKYKETTETPMVAAKKDAQLKALKLDNKVRQEVNSALSASRV